LKAQNAYSIKSVEKGQMYELYNHLLHCFGTALPAKMFLHTRNGFEIDPS